MSEMISRSEVSLYKSKKCLDEYKLNSNDAWLDSACFDAHQAIEFLIKAVLLSKGVFFGNNGLPLNQGHDILFLSTELERQGFEFEKQDELRTLATTITFWEEGSRYGSGVHVHEQTLQRVYKIYDSILQKFLKEQSDNQDDDSP